MLPTLDEVKARKINKGELAEELYEGQTFDYALPDGWVRQYEYDFEFQFGVRLIGAFVWLYDEQAPVFGRPAPLFQGAETWLEIINQSIRR